MSIAFSNTSAKSGIIQLIEKRLGFADGYISGNTTRLAQWTADVNLALDKVLAIIFGEGHTWQFDDSGHSAHPIMTTNIVSGQRDYSFLTDQQGNLILELHKVMVADVNGNFREIPSVDASTAGGAPSNYDDGLDTQGQPNTYDKLGMSLFLDPPANYNRTGGLKVYISREGSYFLVSDTTKKAGFAGIFHKYLVVEPCYNYAVDKTLKSAKGLQIEKAELEEGIKDHYRKREKDVRKRLTGRVNNAH